MNRRTMLLVTAHPDDESFGPGGTIARYAASGVRVVLVCATRGEAGKAGDPPVCSRAELPRVREEELRRAAAVLRIAEVRLLGYGDGMVDRVPAEEAVAAIAGHISAVAPQVVVTFPPGGISGHRDHRAISRYTREAFDLVRRSAPRGARPAKLYYWTLPAERIRAITGAGPEDPADARHTARIDVSSYLELKIRAIRCHRTQHLSMDRVFRGFPPEVREALRYEYFYRAYPEIRPGEPEESDLWAGVV